MMSSESGWTRPHEYSWPRWSRPNDWHRNGYDRNGYDDRYESDYWMKQGRWLDSRGPGWLDSRGPGWLDSRGSGWLDSRGPGWLDSRGPGWLDSRGPGYERPRRYNGDWMREAPWMRESWLREPWMGGPHWARSEWSRWETEGPPVVKVIEIVAQSPHSWEDATRRAVAEASQTIRGIRSIYIQDMQAVVDDEHVVGFRVNAKVSFTLEDNRRRR